ncbi:MAG TPA: hypothetical protein OIM05_02855 [Oscillospiraceae bacterium]|jgi:hypothetical protein|uniref:hypothetical protein n=1 Tax=Ruminococcus callidus TaxID=40519 RepID=UPI00266DAE5D|nr:hypothetical protein [uncultured Ruminococcus sp.]HJH91910.1 hypothetical protein [Oscillospiraceae bacterium]
MKKQIATLLALSTAAACILIYQPTAVGAEEYSVLDNTDKLVQEALEDNTDELGDALYDSVTEGEVPLYEADASSTQSELEKAAIEKGMYKDTFSFANHLCTLSQEDFAKRVYEPVRANMTDSEIDLGYEADISRVAYKGGLCFGMTAISVLVHNGELTPGDLQEGAETLYDVTLTDDVDALIAYYNSLQLYTEVELAVITAPAMLTKEEHTDMFLDCAARCKEKGTYFMAGIATKKGGTHAVVGMDELSGNWTFDGISYDTCIITYDSNCVKPGTETSAFKDDACIYINSETKQFCIPAYEASTENGDVLLYATDDDSLLTYKAPIRGTTKTNTDVSETVKLKFHNGGKDQMQLSSTTKDGQTYDFWKLSKVNYGDYIFFGKGSSFHLEKNERAPEFAFSIKGEGYRLRIEQSGYQNPNDPKLYDVGTKCKMDFSKDSVAYTNTDTQKITVSYIFTYDEGGYKFAPVASSTIVIDVPPNQTITVSKQDTGFAITGDGEVLVQAIPTAAQKEQDAFDGSYEEYLDWFGSYFINFVRSKDVLLQFNTEKECSELVYDFDGDGVFDDAPMLGDADGNGKPYEPNDIYWTALHIAKKAVIGHGSRRYYQGNVPNIEADTDNNGKIDTNDLFDIVYECALRGAGLKK